MTFPVYDMPVKIKPYSCGPGGILFPHGLCNILQEAASEHADHLGFGFDDLDKQHVLWILSVLHIEIETMPEKGMDFVLSTWPSGITRVKASREFNAVDSEGNTLFTATSDWLVLDGESRKPLDLRKLDGLFPIHEKRVTNEKLKRHKPRGDFAPLETIRVPFSALDLNGHVNNTAYPRWAFDALWAAGIRGSVKTIWMTYHSEVFADDQIELRHREHEGAHEVVGYRENSPAFSAVFTFKE